MTKERKVRKVKKTIPNGSLVSVVEVEYTSSQRMSLEAFHNDGQYSSVEGTLRVRAEIIEGMVMDIDELCESVDRRLEERIVKKIHKGMRQLDKGSSI